MPSTTKTYKTLGGAQQNAAPGTQPLKLESAEQATELGFDPKHVGKYVLVHAEPTLEDAKEGDIVTLSDGSQEQIVANGTSVSVEPPIQTGDEEVVVIPNTLKANRGESTIKKPVSRVHELTKQMLDADPNARRKDIVAACINEGIAFYTARTQVQIALKKYRGQQGVGAAVAAPTPPPVSTEVDEDGTITVTIDGAQLLQDVVEQVEAES